MLEPGRSLVSRAGVTLYTVGGVKRASAATTYVTVDGGMSDNPRPAMYAARYTALLANRADEQPTGAYAVAGKHCESGDVLIERVELPAPRRGDMLAVPVTGAYTLAMSSTYNAVPRPAAVLVAQRRGAADPPPRDDRRPARLRNLGELPGAPRGAREEQPVPGAAGARETAEPRPTGVGPLPPGAPEGERLQHRVIATVVQDAA